MIVELGHYALVLAFGLALAQAVLPMLGAARRDAALIGVAVPAALGQHRQHGLGERHRRRAAPCGCQWPACF